MSELTDIAAIIGAILGPISVIWVAKMNSQVQRTKNAVDSTNNSVAENRENIKKVGKVSSLALQKIPETLETLRDNAEATVAISDMSAEEAKRKYIHDKLKLEKLQREIDITRQQMQRTIRSLPEDAQINNDPDLPR
jgi:hypothetical protein